jgi:hypothetical protein
MDSVLQQDLLWKNDVVVFSSPWGSSFRVRSFFVSDNDDVYVVGYNNNNYPTPSVARLWINGVAQDLTDGTKPAEAYSVYVSGNDVYVAGYEGNVAMLWKNGVAQDLTDGTKPATANAVYVSGSDVYVVGVEDGVVMLWKNSVAQSLTNKTVWAKVRSVFVSGNDVYVVGTAELNVVKLWKNGVAQNLPASYGVVYVSGSDVYMADGGLWKNNVLQYNLTGEFTWLSSIFVSGNDVYVGGTEWIDNNNYGVATGKLWKNGVVQHYSPFDDHPVYDVVAIFVK